jgi:hypothetical protein
VPTFVTFYHFVLLPSPSRFPLSYTAHSRFPDFKMTLNTELTRRLGITGSYLPCLVQFVFGLHFPSLSKTREERTRQEMKEERRGERRNNQSPWPLHSLGNVIGLTCAIATQSARRAGRHDGKHRNSQFIVGSVGSENIGNMTFRLFAQVPLKASFMAELTERPAGWLDLA